MFRNSRRRGTRQRDVLIVSFILIKVLVLFVLWAGFDFHGKISASNQVYAKEDVGTHGDESREPSAEAESPEGDHPEDLILSIQREQEALRDREEKLRQREAKVRERELRLQAVERDIERKLETLSQIQASLAELIQEKKSLDSEILKKLARVYESTPPEQAGPMLASLDVGLAAQILIRMDGRKAGRIWGFVSPERASEISAEIDRLQWKIRSQKSE